MCGMAVAKYSNWVATIVLVDGDQVIVQIGAADGACVVALGSMASGLFTRHDELAEGVEAAGRAAGEKIWRLPLYDEYLEQLKSFLVEAPFEVSGYSLISMILINCLHHSIKMIFC